MCPIQDTDSGEERWSQAEWEHYELWEKREARERRRRRLWLIAGFAVFLGLSSIPIVRERGLEWKAVRAARELAQQITHLKVEAGRRQQAFRLQVDQLSALTLLVSWAPGCQSGAFTPESSIQLLANDPLRDQLGWLTPQSGSATSFRGLVSEWCFDPLAGNQAAQAGVQSAGFVIAPASDLTGSQAPERHAVVLVSGPSAEISFE